MLHLIGLSHLSDKELFLLFLLATCCSLTIGWIMELIMHRIGFGIFGNAIVCILGMLVGLAAYNRYYGSMRSPEIIVVMAFAFTSIMLHLIVLSVLRRVLRM